MADLSRLLRRSIYGDRLLADGILTVPNTITESPMASGELYFTHTVLADRSPINTIRTWVGGTVATNPAQTHASIGVYTWDGTTYTRVAQTGNVVSLWTDDFSEVEVPLTTNWLGGHEGLEIAVGALHIAASAHPALPDAGGWYARNFAAYPYRIGSYITAQTGQPASVAASGTGPNSRRYLFGLINDPDWTAP